jgi:hypothetical protein
MLLKHVTTVSTELKNALVPSISCMAHPHTLRQEILRTGREADCALYRIIHDVKTQLPFYVFELINVSGMELLAFPLPIKHKMTNIILFHGKRPRLIS